MQREHSVHHQRRLQQRWDPTLHEAGLFEAARVGDIATLRWLFENGCEVDHQVGQKKAFAAEDRGILILRHAHVVVQDNNGNTVLMLAARLNHLDVAKMCLLDYNAK